MSSTFLEVAEAHLVAAGWTPARREGWWTPPEHGLPHPTLAAIGMHHRDLRDAATRALFADFDGVVNDAAWRTARDPFPRRGGDGLDLILSHAEHEQLLRAWLDPARVSLVDEIARRSGAVVVISSSWRAVGLDVVRPALWDAGLRAPVVDRLASTDWARARRSRGARITDWIARHPKVTRWCALDDQASHHEIDPAHVVETTDAAGLTREHVEHALAILGGAP